MIIRLQATNRIENFIIETLSDAFCSSFKEAGDYLRVTVLGSLGI